MRINHKILSLPPYLSASWKNITALQLQENEGGLPLLVVSLANGSQVKVPGLNPQVLEAIFAAHAKFAEQEGSSSKQPQHTVSGQVQEILTIKLPFDLPGLAQLSGLMQHNEEQKEAPDLPPEILEKVATLARTMDLPEGSQIPKPEPHCNCIHCQITRALHQATDKESSEEDVSEEDLRFRNWDIAQITDKLYAVTSPLDTKESYRVFLGDPIGCNCGQKNCEHLRAVLIS